MLRIASISIFLLFALNGTCQVQSTEDFKHHFEEGKAEFRKKFEDQDFQKAVGHLEKAVKIDAKNPEAWYFLGYAYSRLNAKDGKGIMGMHLELTEKCSHALETCLSINAKYEGEIISQDPYYKITSEWGSQALKYLYSGKKDSATWAFKEGKKRGGFDEFTVNLNKKILESCNKQSILIASGDNITFPLAYLQCIENFRTDVSVIDVSLLNTQWYPHILAETGEVEFDVPIKHLDTLNYRPWKDSVMTIKELRWTLKPTYYRQFILRGDRVLLSILNANEFKRDVFFTIGFDEKLQLNLQNRLDTRVLVGKLDTDEEVGMNVDEYEYSIKYAFELSKYVDLNSTNQIAMFDLIRYDLLGHVNDFLNLDSQEPAKKLMTVFDEFGAVDSVPFFSEQGPRYTNYLRGRFTE